MCCNIGISSNGRTEAFEAFNRGSNPCIPALRQAQCNLIKSMDKDLENKIKRAKELITTSRHMSIATVNEDGSPHNSPIRFIYDPKIEYIYWGSHPESMHSRNIKRTGKIFCALYDRVERGGVYLKSDNAHELSGEELKEALKIHNDFRIKEGSSPLELSYYEGNSPQRMWGAKINNFWVNYAEKGPDGHLTKDGRIEITAKDLLAINI